MMHEFLVHDEVLEHWVYGVMVRRQDRLPQSRAKKEPPDITGLSLILEASIMASGLCIVKSEDWRQISGQAALIVHLQGQISVMREAVGIEGCFLLCSTGVTAYTQVMLELGCKPVRKTSS